MKIIIGSDHAGKDIRKKVIEHLSGKGNDIIDCGTNNDTSNYAIEGIKVAENISMKKGDLGYTDNDVTWKGSKYARKDGKIQYKGKWLPEGDHSFPWEKKAHNA